MHVDNAVSPRSIFARHRNGIGIAHQADVRKVLNLANRKLTTEIVRRNSRISLLLYRHDLLSF
jgi:hypothetical protein